MKKNEECKIVRDLLPSCVDKITDEITNEFIQNHIQGCEECKKILENMGEEIILDKVKEKEKLDYLKRVRRKQGVKIAVVTIILLAMIGLAVLFCMFMVKGYLLTDEEGNVQYVKSFISWVSLEFTGDDIFNADKAYKSRTKQRTHISYTIIISKGYDETVLTQIFTFDKEKDICLGMRAIYESPNPEKVKKEYEELLENEKLVQNYPPNWYNILDVELREGKVFYSYNFNGMPEERVRVLIDAYRKGGNEIIEI